MPILHCEHCHHEWETMKEKEKCDWCGGDSYILDLETPLSRFLKNKDELLKILKEIEI